MSLLVVLIALSLLPNTPLLRIFFPFFIIMQLCIFMMAMNTKVKTLKYAIIALLLLETALTLPSTLFIRLGPTENNSPIQVFEDERKIVRYFDYGQPEELQGAKEEAGKSVSGEVQPPVK